MTIMLALGWVIALANSSIQGYELRREMYRGIGYLWLINLIISQFSEPLLLVGLLVVPAFAYAVLVMQPPNSIL